MSHDRSARSSEHIVQRLRADHADLEARLGELDRRRSLSAEEEYEKQVLKKRKLAIKDRLSRADV